MSSRLKILHISKFYPPEPGGIERFVHDLAGVQVKKGHEVCVLAHQAGFGKKTVSEQIKGVKVCRVRSLGQAAYAPIAPEFPLVLFSLLHRFKPDVIHAHVPNPSAFWLLFIRKPCFLVLHWHADVDVSSMDRKMGFLYQFYRPWEVLLLKKADRVIATSHAYFNASRPLSRFKKKTRVVPLGIDPERLAGVSPASFPKTPHTLFTVLSVGRFTYYKGFEFLVDAAEKVPDAEFILVGDGPCYSAIKKRVAQKRLEDRVHLPGRVDDNRLRELFSRCDAFCLPSVERTEAFGMVLLEAMCFGKPLITTKIEGSGVLEVNIDGVTGLQVPPADSKALAEAVNILKHNRTACIQMGEQARRRLERHFLVSNLKFY